MSPLQSLLLAVARHMRRERLAVTARYAAWAGALVALLAVLLHLFVRPVSATGLALCLALTVALAAWQAFVTPTTPADCAAWADRHLDGRSAYATCLEVFAQPREQMTPAMAHLEALVARAAPSSLAQLSARPFDARLGKPYATALVCVALATVLLQLPTRARAPEARAPATPGATPTAFTQDDDDPGMQTPAAAVTPPHDAPTSASLPAGARDAAQQRATPSDGRDAAAEERSARHPRDDAAAAAAGTASRHAATGREAGDVADPSGDTVFTAPSQAALAARLREIAAQSPQRALQADASQDADFTDAAAADAGLAADASLTAAAATPPPASAAQPLAPAEQAYLRAYWSDRRTNP